MPFRQKKNNDMKLIEEIARNCEWHKSVNSEYMDECETRIEKCENHLPSGSGIDAGCKIDVDRSGINKVVITFGWHFLNENGYYDGWQHYKLTVKSTLIGFTMVINGRNRDGIKDYLYQLFDYALNENFNII